MFGGHHYTWDFLLADVQFYIIGVDFLKHFKLVEDVAANLVRCRCRRRCFYSGGTFFTFTSHSGGTGVGATCGPAGPA